MIFLFLRNLSATIIPSLALPGSIVATFAVMYLLGYSLDNLSLMALTLSVGFVVDDAIVMLENIVRHMEMGKPPMRAAFDGSKEIAFTILSMTLSLAAVFIPVLFMGGVVGRLLHEFAVTIGVAILVSGFVSISLTPMLCSRFLKPPHAQRHGWLYNAIERMFERGCGSTTGRCGSSLRFHVVTMAVSVALLVGTVYLFGLVPKGFLPSEDQGRLQHQHRSDAGHRLRRDGAPPDAGRRHRREGPGRRSTFSNNVGGGPRGGALNTGRIWVDLKPRAERQVSVDQMIAELRPKLAQVPGVRVFMVNQPPINLGGQAAAQRSLYQFTLQDTDTDELYHWAPILEEKMREIARPRGRQQRPADQEPAGHGRHGPRQDLGARPDRRTRSRPRSTTPTARARCRRSTRRTISTRSSCRWRRSSRTIPRRCRCSTCARAAAG